MQSAISRRLLKPAILLVTLLGLAWLAHQAYRLWQFETLFAPENIVENFRSMPTLFDSNLVANSGPVFELESAPQELPKDFRFQGKRIAISDWISQSDSTALVVLANGKLVYEDYYQGNDGQSQAISWSVGKSFVSTLIGFALADGSIKSLKDPVGDYVPLLKQGGYADVSIQDVLEMSSGIDFNENYADPESSINQLGEEIFFGRSTN